MISNDLLKQKILSNLIPFGKCENITLSKLVSKGKIGDGDWILSDDMCEYSSNKLVQLGSIGYGKYIPKNFKYITDETYERINCSEITFGDLLINRFISNSTMTCCILPCIEGRTITSVDVCWIKEDKDKYLNKYLMYCFLTKEFQDKVLNMSSGTTRIRISKNNLIKIEFPLPSISEQKKIVKKIEELFELIDKKEENDQEKDKLKLLLKEKILDSAIHGKLVENDLTLNSIDVNSVDDIPFEIPSNWKWTYMSECYEFKQGVQIDVELQSMEKSEENSLQFLRIVDFTQNNNDIRYVSKKYSDYTIDVDDISIVRYGASAGFICIGKQGVLANNLFKLNKRISIESNFAFYLLNSDYFQHKIRPHSTAMPALKFASLNKILLPIPPLEQQKKIVEKIEQCFELIEQL